MKAHREPLALDGDPARREALEEQVRDRLVEQVDIVHVQHAAVCLRKQTGLKDGHARTHRLLDVDGPKQPVLEHVERHLDERRGDYLRLHICDALTALRELLLEERVHFP